MLGASLGVAQEPPKPGPEHEVRRAGQDARRRGSFEHPAHLGTGELLELQAEAEQIGFVNFSVPLARLEEETMTLAREIASKDAAALKGGGELLCKPRRTAHHRSASFADPNEHGVGELREDRAESCRCIRSVTVRAPSATFARVSGPPGTATP
mgnify:CR=1 FL=1